eukprot:1413588-Rhodomonas_salina.1
MGVEATLRNEDCTENIRSVAADTCCEEKGCNEGGLTRTKCRQISMRKKVSTPMSSSRRGFLPVSKGQQHHNQIKTKTSNQKFRIGGLQIPEF